MKLFNTISIEISSMCNRACKWCPVAYNERPDERMDAKVVAKVLRELAELDYRGRVELYIYNEPTRDWQYLLDTIAQVRTHLPRATIMIATNGDYMRGQHHILKLFDAGLNQLLINCYVKNLAGKRAKWLDNLPPEIKVVTGGIYAATGARSKLVQIADKHDPASFGDGVFGLINRAGNIPTFMAASPEPLARMCVKPFRIFNINWKGEALLCCQDYHGEVKVGNVRKHTIEELWNSPVLNNYRRHLLAKDRSLPLCKVCDCHAGAYPHNVPHPDGE